MTTAVSSPPRQRFFDSNGEPLASGLVFTYAAGTTTKLATFTDSTGATPNKNPIVLDAAGYADVWFTSGVAYKLVLSPSTDTDPPTNPFWTVDNLVSFAASGTLATLGGNNTFTGANTLQGTTAFSGVATFSVDPVFTSTTAGPSLEPSPTLFHNQPAPANADVAGQVSFQANNVRPTQKEFANIRALANNVTVGNEGGALTFNATIGSVSTQVGIAGTVSVGGTVSAGFQIQGTQTNDNPPTGYVGEYMSSLVLPAAQIGVATGAVIGITHLQLTPGDWDVWGNPVFTGGITTSVTALIGGLNTTTAIPNTPGQQSNLVFNNFAVFNNDGFVSMVVGPTRVLVNTVTSYWLNASASFTLSTCSIYGVIQARRRR